MTIVLTLVLATCSACTTSEDDAEGVEFSNICGSSLSDAAAESLEEITGETRLRQKVYDSPNKAREYWKKSDIAKFFMMSICTVYTTESSKGRMNIEFARHTGDTYGKYDLEEPGSKYRLGKFAYQAKESAVIVTRCPSSFPPKTASYIDGYITWNAELSKVGPKRTGRALMTILNSVARTIAKDLNCLGDANLPKHLPKPEPKKNIDLKKVMNKLNSAS